MMTPVAIVENANSKYDAFVVPSGNLNVIERTNDSPRPKSELEAEYLLVPVSVSD